jgi:hypothetical protein
VFNNLGQLQTLFADGILIDTGEAGLFPLTFLLPMGVSLVALARSLRAADRRARLVGLLILAVVLHAVAWPTFLGRWRLSEIRHVQVITPFLMMMAADGLVRLWDRSAVRRCLSILLAAHFVVFVFLYHTLLVDTLAVAPPYNTADIQALRQVEPQLDPEAIFISRKPNRAAYYTGRPAVMMPLAGFKDLMAYAQAHGVTHLLAVPRELRTRPGLVEGLAAMPESIKLLAEVNKTQIFEIRDYDFLPAIAEGGPLDQEVDLAAPAPPPDWEALVRRTTPSTLSQVWLTWRRWLGGTP